MLRIKSESRKKEEEEKSQIAILVHWGKLRWGTDCFTLLFWKQKKDMHVMTSQHDVCVILIMVKSTQA